MTRTTALWRILSVATIAFAVGVAPGFAFEHDDDEEIELDEANVFFELNDTDGDLGIHSLIDGEAWKHLKITDHHERTILNISLRGRLRQQGLTELFFESAEPSFDDLAPEVFFERFPEGTYEIEGVTLEGEEIEGEAEVTHLMPAPPDNVQVSTEDAAEDCDAELPSVSEPVVIRWDPVRLSHPDLGRSNEPIEVVKYEIVVEREEPETLVLKADLPPDVTSFEVPSDFIALDSGDGFKFEILVRESSGNQTAIESCFEVE